jgi:citrate synthase
VLELATLAGAGNPYIYPDNDLSFTGNFLNMLFKMTEVKYQPNKKLERALDVLFILHADHEQNCSTNAVRGVGSSQVDPYSAVAAGVAHEFVDHPARGWRHPARSRRCASDRGAPTRRR